MAHEVKGLVRSRRRCCVYGCNNTEKNNRSLKFYSFPGRQWEVDRKKKWIEFVKDAAPLHKKSWEPTANSRICSAHFYGGEKSNSINSISYFPTIVDESQNYSEIKVENMQPDDADPLKITTRDNTGINHDVYNQPLNPQNCILFKELKDGVTVKMETDCEPQFQWTITPIRYVFSSPPPTKKAKKMVTIGLQTDASINVPTSDKEILFCFIKDNNASVQTNIIIKNPLSSREKKVTVTDKNVTTEDKRVGHDFEVFPGFVGMPDLDNDHALKQFTGINRDMYNILLSKIELRKNGQPAFYKKIHKENRLLLFLMKSKLDLSFGALGAMFHIHASSASKVFSEVLKTLSIKTNSWLFPLETCSLQADNVRTIVIEKIERNKLPAKVKMLMFANPKGVVMKKVAVAFTCTGRIIKVWETQKEFKKDSTKHHYYGENLSFKHGDLILMDYNNFSLKCDILSTYNVIIDCSVESDPDIDFSSKTEYVIDVERSFHKLKSFRVMNHISVDVVPSLINIIYVCSVLANIKYYTILTKIQENE